MSNTEFKKSDSSRQRNLVDIFRVPKTPADLPPRGLNGNDLVNCNLWWNGPEFLRNPKCERPEYSTLHSLNETAAKEIIKQLPTAAHSLVNVEADDRL